MKTLRSKYALPVALGIAVVLLLAAVPVIADLVVSYTLRPVTASDISQVVFRPGNAAGEIIVPPFNTQRGL